VKKEERFNANERKWTQMNANSAERWVVAVRASQVLNDPANLQTRRTEIDQKAKVHAGRSQIIYALRAMRAVKRLDGLQFDQDSALNQQIGKIFTDQDAFVANIRSALLLNSEPRRAQLKRQGILINLLKESGPQSVCNRKRATDDPVRYRIQRRPIRVHLRPFAFICVKPFFLSMLPARYCQTIDVPAVPRRP
jgi:hypothetical protein